MLPRRLYSPLVSNLIFWLRFGPYTILTTILLPLGLAFFALAPNVRGSLGDRLGRPRIPPPPKGRRRIVFHGASYGDIRTLEPVLQRVRERGFDVVVSAMTRSGFEHARRLGFPAVHLAVENYWMARAWVRALQPSLVVFEYMEFWPSVVAACHHEGVRVAFHNVHVNPRSVVSLRLAGLFLGPVLRSANVFLVQSPLDRWRLRRAGAEPDRIRVTGDTKQFRVADPAIRAIARRIGGQLGWSNAQPRVVFGSYQPAEEELLLRWLPRLASLLPRWQFVVAPRYPDRDTGFLARLREDVPEVARRSDRPKRARVVLLDSMGELAAMYWLSQLAVVMGSFVPRGGQNPLEPALAGVPILYGPSMDNFRDEVKLLEGVGAQTVPNADALVPLLVSLLSDPEERRRRGMLAQSVVLHLAAEGKAAVERNVQALFGLARGDAS